MSTDRVLKCYYRPIPISGRLIGASLIIIIIIIIIIKNPFINTKNRANVTAKVNAFRSLNKCFVPLALIKLKIAGGFLHLKLFDFILCVF